MLLSLEAESYAGEQSHLLEGAIVFVVIKKIGTGVIRHIEIRPAIVVVVGPDTLHSVTAFGIVYSGFFGNIFKGPVSPVVKEEIGLPGKTSRTALHQNSPEAAKLIVAAKFRKLIDVNEYVAWYE